MSSQEELPRYRLLQEAFFAPDMLPAGAEISYDGVPGDHLEPLNEAADLAMETWYNSEVPEYDPKTKELTGKMIKVRAGRRPTPYEATLPSNVTIESMPPEGGEKVQSLAEIMALRKPTQQRPGPSIKRTATPRVITAPKPEGAA